MQPWFWVVGNIAQWGRTYPLHAYSGRVEAELTSSQKALPLNLFLISAWIRIKVHCCNWNTWFTQIEFGNNFVLETHPKALNLIYIQQLWIISEKITLITSCPSDVPKLFFFQKHTALTLQAWQHVPSSQPGLGTFQNSKILFSKIHISDFIVIHIYSKHHKFMIFCFIIFLTFILIK